MIVEVAIIDVTERGVQVRVGDGAPMWLPRHGPGIEWQGGVPEPGDVVWVRLPPWLIAKHKQLQELRYQRSLAFVQAAGLDPAKAQGPLPMADYTPSFPLTRLFRKTSKGGGTYFTGRLGNARVALLKSKYTADDGAEIWDLLVSEAPKRDDAGQQQDQQRQPEPQRNSYADGRSGEPPHQGGDFMRKVDSEIPF